MGGSGGPRASIAEGFRSRFWLPPRPHGQAIEDRTVSFLELFYDLVFVVVVAQAAHTLAHHLSWDGAADFAVVFGLIWIAWLNGTLHHEIHGHEDGRSRTFIFVQMTVLVVLAIYTGDATGEGGSGFALTYAVLLAVLTWLWYAVRRQDDGEYRSATDPYIAGMAVSTVVVAGSAALDDQARVVVWGLLVIAWVLGGIVNVWTSGGVTASGVTATDSMAERFGLFTIIVLGEVVVGVATGLSVVDRDALSVGTGVLALMIGFGFWWTYFDFVGRRVPRREGLVPAVWVYLHLPATMAIAAAGAAMVGLVEHAGDDHTAAPTAWLIGGAMALFLLALLGILATVRPDPARPDPSRSTAAALLGAAGISLLIAWWAPAPWLLAASLALVASALWFLVIGVLLRFRPLG